MELVLVERRGGVGLVTLNRPEKLNALSSELVTQLESALRELEANRDLGYTPDSASRFRSAAERVIGPTSTGVQ